MAIESDAKQVREALKRYADCHPRARIDVKTHGDWAIRVRIVDPDLKGIDRAAREDEVWPILQELPDDVFTCITMLLVLTPDEQRGSMANLEFEDPTPSRI